MSLPKHFNVLMASALSISIAATPVGIVPAAQSAPAAEAPGDPGWQKNSNSGAPPTPAARWPTTRPI